MTKKPKLLLYLVLIITVLSVICLMNIRKNKIDNSYSDVMTVYGEKVALGEFKLFFNDSIGHTFQYFHEKYGATDSEKFWETSFQGEIPIEWAKREAVEKLKVIKAEQVLMKRAGLLEDISYEAFIHQLEEENKRRSAALTKGEVIYGPQQFNEREYFSYFHSNMMIRLREWFDINEGLITDEALNQTYEHWKSTAPEQLKRPDYIQTQLIKIPFGKAEGEQRLSKQQAKEMASKIRSELEKSPNNESTGDLDAAHTEIETRVFDESTFREDRGEGEEWLFSIVNQLSKDEISELIERPAFFLVIKCLDRKQGEYISFEESKAMIKSKYLEEKLQYSIDQMVAGAKVEINSGVYDKVNVR